MNQHLRQEQDPHQRSSSALVLPLCLLLFHLPGVQAVQQNLAVQAGCEERILWNTRGLCYREFWELDVTYIQMLESVRSKCRHRLRISARKVKSWGCSQ